jgi:pimeloyl-ACP methyl ester carboxylesterase
MPYNLADVLVETQAEMDYDARPVLSQITAPVLIIAGDRDRFLPREVIEETARGITDCTVIWHVGHSHIKTIKGKRTPGEVLAFLDEHTRQQNPSRRV